MIVRRELLKIIGASLASLTGAACTRTVTKHGPDGKPYDAQETDAAGTVLVLMLLASIIGGIVLAQQLANKSNKERDNGDIDPRRGSAVSRGFTLFRWGDAVSVRTMHPDLTATIRGAGLRETALLHELPDRVQVAVSHEELRAISEDADVLLSEYDLLDSKVRLSFQTDPSGLPSVAFLLV